MLGHSGRDGAFGVGHGANGDVVCDAVGGGDRGCGGRYRRGPGSGSCLSPGCNDRGRCGCCDRSPGRASDQRTSVQLWL